MAKIISSILIPYFIIACVPVQVAPSISLDKDVFHAKTWRIAVLDLDYEFEDEGDLNGTHYVSGGRDGGSVVAGLLATELLGLNNVKVIERQKISQIIEEQSLQQTGMISSETALRIGQLAGAEAIIIGTLTDYVYWENTGVTGTTVSFSMRMIEIETGNVILNGSISRIRTLVDMFPNAQLTTKEMVEAIKKS